MSLVGLAEALLRLGGDLSGLVCGYAGQLGTGCAKKWYLACQFLYKMGKKRTFLVPRLCAGILEYTSTSNYLIYIVIIRKLLKGKV
jgi:hypothetical protein